MFLFSRDMFIDDKEYICYLRSVLQEINKYNYYLSRQIIKKDNEISALKNQLSFKYKKFS